MQTDLQGGSSILHSHPQWIRVPLPHIHPPQPVLLLLLFLLMVLLTRVSWNLKVDLLWLFLIAKNVDHVFQGSLDISYSVSCYSLFILYLNAVFCWFLWKCCTCIQWFWIILTPIPPIQLLLDPWSPPLLPSSLLHVLFINKPLRPITVSCICMGMGYTLEHLSTYKWPHF